MITSEVRSWLEKVKRGQYSYQDAMYKLNSFLPYLTKEELLTIKTKIQEAFINIS